MQRQKSLLSFFQKSPSDKRISDGGASSIGQRLTRFPAKQGVSGLEQPAIKTTADPSLEIRGTDTPPEKVPRQILPVIEKNKGSSLFSSIMHKFVRVDDKRKAHQRDEVQKDSSHDEVRRDSSQLCSISGKVNDSKEFQRQEVASAHHDKLNAANLNGIRGPILVIVSDDEIPGPETPGMKPSVSRLKRSQEDFLEDASGRCFQETTKRVKLLQDSINSNKIHNEVSDATSKFEWLNPSQVRDANGRRPGHPLYDKKTLYIPPDVLKKMSASQKQYWNVKCQYMDVLLFFKVVGVPESGIDDAVQKLVARGYKVGRVEQLESSDQTKTRGANSVIPRKLIQVVTPSTKVDGDIGPDAVHLLAIKEVSCGLDSNSIAYGFAFVDCAALKFWTGVIKDDASCAALGALLMQVSPKEIIYEARGLSKETQKVLKKFSPTGSTALEFTSGSPVTDFLEASEVKLLIQSKGYFKGSLNLWNHTVEDTVHDDIALCALGGLISHMSRMMLDDVLRNGEILPYQVYRGCLRMDGQTMVNLEIFRNNDDGGPSGTLYKYLDNCVTSSGKRLLRLWICHPLKDVQEINIRLNVVEELMAESEVMLLLGTYLRKLPDLERLLGQIKATVQSSASLILPLIRKKLQKRRVKLFGSLVKGLRTALDLLIQVQKEGYIISLSKVVKLPLVSGSGGLDQFLSQFEAAVDSEFPNYQNHDVTDSDAERLSILIELFVEKATEWSEVIHALNCIDVLRSFAVIAHSSGGSMSRPVILPQSNNTTLITEKQGPVLKINGLWHPYALVENGETPVPNDIILGPDQDGYHPRTLLLTGPNMGGKSTLLRSTCLAVILAQLGCYVPCETCTLSVVDIIFTRLGATDRIMTGESTFLVECSETASVLQHATQHALVILDELGRGTSTFDGYAIAYAVFRHLIEKVNCRLLFATHYHPLTKEFASHPHVVLQHMACTFKDQELVFLYRLNSGPCPESYGLQVAAMAGIPGRVVEAASRASQVLKKTIKENFRSSEQRSEFSTLHEEWLKTLITVSEFRGNDLDDTDAFDTLFCLWYELKKSYHS
ncbi:DNA mismatch repair protein MSH7 isoform X2 [Momordica charantia]|uniref:DNA mismatch repair protein MSH7 isoform X2 n=1 Tax=Momordica charantia TaxID=3673 RepID=A0A6J1DUT8_MOMCH|nr:DNA mismatch repair protein MSH7 isoform X2 [Momordica charantia]